VRVEHGAEAKMVAAVIQALKVCAGVQQAPFDSQASQHGCGHGDHH
jgi:hypothetical protein